jgi:replicative DNA helicase
MISTNGGGVDRIPPNNLEAEMACLGSILVDREMMSAVSEILGPSDFYAVNHETIFAALVGLYERGEPLDKITVAEELRNRNLLDRVGGLSYLTRLMDTVPTAASAEYYARIVSEKSALRGLIHAGTQITQIGFENEEDVEGAVDRSEQIVYEVGRKQKTGDFAPIYKLLKGTFEQIDRLYHSRGDHTGLTSGFRDVDEMTAGFQPGNFIILAARPAMGKTSMALTMAAAAAKDEQKPVAIFSLEMTNEELVTRLLCAEARINSQNLRRGNIRDQDWEKISHGMSELSKWPIYIDDSGTITVTEIRSRCRRLQSGEGLAAVFIDYLQLVRPSTSGKQQNRNDELSDICRTLKATAKDLQVPIIALAQLNRGVESRNDKRPMLSDLRDCLPGDARVLNASTGERIAIADIVREGLRFDVWALDGRDMLVRRPIVDAWAVGVKPLFRVTTASGRVIRCTDGHRFKTESAWQQLSELTIGDAVLVPEFIDRPAVGCAQLKSGISGSAVAELLLAVDETDRRRISGRIAWDPIASIEPCGREETFDLTVSDHHNFCVDDFITHNSGAIEQEADIVTFLYRDAYYNPESAVEQDLTEFIIAKSRNGPTGTVKMRFLKEYTLFVPYGDNSHYATP